MRDELFGSQGSGDKDADDLVVTRKRKLEEDDVEEADSVPKSRLPGDHQPRGKMTKGRDSDQEYEGEQQGEQGEQEMRRDQGEEPRPTKRAKVTVTAGEPSGAAATVQWKEGDKCRAYYKEDGLYYVATVTKVRGAKRQVEVEFVGYDSSAVVGFDQILPCEENENPGDENTDAVATDDDGGEPETPKEILGDQTEEEPESKPRFEVAPSGLKEPLVLQEENAEKGKKRVEVNPFITQYLRDYQKEGVRFLFGLYTKGIGGLLGDDMGLGKTIQVISFVSAVLGKTGIRDQDIRPRRSDGPKPVLIVCPSAVLFNWKREFQTWGYFAAEVYHGGKKKDQVLENIQRGKSEILITTFETLRINRAALDRVEWELVIADEVHRLKEPKAKVTEAFKSLRIRRRYGLTGTPIQNAFKELWCLLDWANPDAVGTWSNFDTTIANPMLQGQKFNASKVELTVAKHANDKLQEFLQKFFLRRTKALIAHQLPKKQDFVVFCNFGKKQEEVYKSLYDIEEMQLISHKDDRCDCGFVTLPFDLLPLIFIIFFFFFFPHVIMQEDLQDSRGMLSYQK